MYRILYVDDDPFLLEIGKDFLEEYQVFTVDTITSAVKALILENLSSYDAIISDYEMPGMNGIEFLKKVREQFEDLPFVLFTGKGREEVVIEALNSGADFYLQKGGNPVSQFAELSHKVNIAIERKLNNAALKQDELRMSLMIKFYEMTSVPLRELMVYAIEEAVKLTSSSVGYLAFVNEDETILTMYAWSSGAMKACNIRKKPFEFPVESTGLWGEAVRQRRPVITNDYHAPNPQKKGCPSGHIPLDRHMNIPVFEGSHIAMVAGVANKPSDYTDRDVRDLNLLMTGLWTVIKQRRAEETLRDSEEIFRCLVQQSHDGILLIDENGRIVEWNAALTRIFGISRKEAINRPYLDLVLPLIPADHCPEIKIERIRDEINNALKTGESEFFYRPLIVEICLRDGQYRNLEQITFPIRTDNGFRIGSITREIPDRWKST